MDKRFEIVTDWQGMLRQVWVLDDDGERLTQIPVTSISETHDPGDLGRITFTAYSARVRRTVIGV